MKTRDYRLHRADEEYITPPPPKKKRKKKGSGAIEVLNVSIFCQREAAIVAPFLAAFIISALVRARRF